MKEMVEKSLDPQLWQACAGGMVNIPPKNSKVFYFPQGHAEHAQSHVDFPAAARIPPSILCRVASLKFMADPESDEVFAKITLIPLGNGDLDLGDDPAAVSGDDPSAVAAEKPASFAKTLTQSDANNGGGFSVPRYCAETIFPRLDYAADPPVQNVVARDVHGGIWKFRHIYRGTPRRHLLTTGWSNFVNQKKLVAGDSIVFLRTQTGEICVGIRRAKRGVSGDPHPVWNNAYSSSGGGCGGLGRKVRPEAVVEAAVRASEGRAFEAVYYPRLSTPEFCVRASAVEAAMRVQWCSGMRFKMAFETEDSSRISWFMGTVGSVHVADPIRWPRSPWRLLQVAWDEPDLLQNVKRVNPWLIESVSNVPLLHLSSYSPPRKKLRLDNTSHHLHFPSPSPAPPLPFPPPPPMSISIGTPFFGNTITAPPAGIQGARHALFGISLSDLYQKNHNNFPAALHHHRHQAPPTVHDQISNEALSCALTMGRPSEADRPLHQRPQHGLVLFGKPILTEQQISDKASSDLLCKVFRESEDVGRSLDLSAFGSYEELYRRLAHMFGLERSEMPTHILYHDAAGVLKTTGDEPFSDFVKTAKRLTISKDSSNKNNARTWITGMRNAENGLGASSKTGPLSIFA